MRPVRQRFPPPPGWSSRHERITDRDGNPVGPGLVQGDFDPMARTAQKDGDVVARGADVPLALSSAGPRDALLDPRETDIIPDLETKGLHVGEVAQPAEPVLHRGGDVTFESLPEAPESRFSGALSFAEQKRLNSELQANDPAYAGRAFVGDAVEGDTRAGARRAPARATDATDAPARSSGSSGRSAADKLDDDSARVASKQAAEDKS